MTSWRIIRRKEERKEAVAAKFHELSELFLGGTCVRYQYQTSRQPILCEVTGDNDNSRSQKQVPWPLFECFVRMVAFDAKLPYVTASIQSSAQKVKFSVNRHNRIIGLPTMARSTHFPIVDQIRWRSRQIRNEWNTFRPEVLASTVYTACLFRNLIQQKE
jgi:hypothetical protein